MWSQKVRAFNFCAGPATIPLPVMLKVKEELLEFDQCGASVIEISHRSEDFIQRILMPAQANFRELLKIPENYEVLFLSQGTSHQFAMVPMNLLGMNGRHKADYWETGHWSKRAINEAVRYGEINVLPFLPSEAPKVDPHAAYFHYTSNETINGIQVHDVPETGEVPLVVDMASEILSRRIDVSRFGLIYAGAQKNIGPSGLTIVIIRKDLIGHAKEFTPTLYNYKTHADSQSLYNTANTFAVYMAGLVFEWLLAQGGVEAIEKINIKKARKLYETIDSTDFYRNEIPVKYRSQMNVVFYCPTPELDKRFIAHAHQEGLIYLRGHKVVGGLRASIYNAMPYEGVEALAAFMKDFEKRYG
jgi:phosphoserine aminotransferase